MKEMLANQTTAGYSNSFVNNNASTSNIASDNARKYAVISTDWVSAIGEELGMHPLPDLLLERLAEDASYRLREILHKCVTRLKHSRRKRLTSADVNTVITSLCDADPILGAPESLPEYHAEAKVYVPNETNVNLVRQVNEPMSLPQTNVPFLQESELCDLKLMEARHKYVKRAVKTLFNGSQKTFQVLLNDCSTNPHLGNGVIDKLMSIARSMVISNNAQYTRVSTRTGQLILAIASNSETDHPYHSTSVDKLTELLLDLLLSSSFIHPNLEVLFQECVLKLMLRWPSIADKYIPNILENTFFKLEAESIDVHKKRKIAVELLASIQPLIFFQCETENTLSIQNILHYAVPGSVIWQRIALAACAFVKSQGHAFDLTHLIEHYGDALLPYLPANHEGNAKGTKDKKVGQLPVTIKSKMKYVKSLTNDKQESKQIIDKRIWWDRQLAFPDSTLKGPRREIRFAFAGGRPVPSSNLRRVSLRANYQILRGDLKATLAPVASYRLLMIKDKKKGPYNFYNLAHVTL